jgi:hypothetical protein
MMIIPDLLFINSSYWPGKLRKIKAHDDGALSQ